ncbi:MAG: hypothetical protein Greene041619_258 [Candidatus Peregrinibacteria bacterium Greene0416_19]|nr:MAG: hypothetical protein Greene041619_258 [Candidatus Peregrinibacteria bacterium Greene0416_19]
MAHMDVLTHALILLTGFFSSFVGTTTGGIGLLIVPVLMFLGLPAQVAVGTTRVGLLSGNATSLYQFHRSGKIDYSIAIPLLVISAVGAYIGARVLLVTPNETVEKLFGFFILCIVGITLLKKDLGVVKRTRPSHSVRGIGYTLMGLISIISAYFSAGTGLLGRPILMLCFGQTFLESAGTRKLQSAAVGITSVAVYIMSGIVHWPYAITLLVGTALGSYAGAAYAIKKGNAWVRKLFIAVVILSSVELLF